MDDPELASLPIVFDSPERHIDDGGVVVVKLFREDWPDLYAWIVRSN